MKSPFTGKEMSLIRENRKLVFRKEEFEFVHHAFRCDDTNEQFTSTELDNLNIAQVYNQYREKHTIPFPEEIKSIREKYGVSAVKMSEILGFGINSYRLYEDGEVPQLSNARLIQNSAESNNFKNMVQLCDSIDEKTRVKITKHIDKIIDEENLNLNDVVILNHLMGEAKPNTLTGYISPKIEKLSEMVVYFSAMLQPYKTKLNKLLFYADFSHYKQTGFSISGVRYRAIDMGPVPNNFQSIFEYIQFSNKIEIKNVFIDNDITGELFKKQEDYTFKKELFSESELHVLETVANLFKLTKTKDIVEMSHDEIAWKETIETKSLIPYSYAFELKHI